MEPLKSLVLLTCSVAIVLVVRTGYSLSLHKHPSSRTPASYGTGLEQFRQRNAENATFAILYRIIGNDMPPLHSSSQTLKNVEFILRNEPTKLPAGWKRKWILNRIRDEHQTKRIRSLLISVGYRERDILVIPFSTSELILHLEKRSVRILDESLPTNATSVQRTSLRTWGPVPDALLSYAVNVNAARNLAIANAREEGTRWALPFDGNEWVNKASWSDMDEFLRRQSASIRAVSIPTYRVQRPLQTVSTRMLSLASASRVIELANVTENAWLGVAESMPAIRVGNNSPSDESTSQVLKFDEELPYGKGEKAVALWHWGCPGYGISGGTEFSVIRWYNGQVRRGNVNKPTEMGRECVLMAKGFSFRLYPFPEDASTASADAAECSSCVAVDKRRAYSRVKAVQSLVDALVTLCKTHTNDSTSTPV